MKKEILKHTEVAHISLRKTLSCEFVELFIKKFSTMLNNDEVEIIEAEIASYQFENFIEIS